MPSIFNKICLENTGCNRVSLSKHEHFCQVRPVYVPSTNPEPVTSNTGTKNISRTHFKPYIPYLLQVTIDPDGILTRETVQAMKDFLARNDAVFRPISYGYNWPVKARVTIGQVMYPQRKGRLLQYTRRQQELLQAHFNELEYIVIIEYINPSFLVKKSSGGFCLVIPFSKVASYFKPQPSLMPMLIPHSGKLANASTWLSQILRRHSTKSLLLEIP